MDKPDADVVSALFHGGLIAHSARRLIESARTQVPAKTKWVTIPAANFNALARSITDADNASRDGGNHG